MKRCTRCGTEHDDDALFCRQDGSPLDPPNSTSGGDPYVGKVLLDQFLVEAVLGEGGMGTVYRAHQTGVDRKVAIKVLRSDVASVPGLAERFTREAKLASRIRSPHVAHVYLTGRLPDGNAMLAMEYLEGKSLDDLLEETGALPVGRAIHIVRQIAEAAAEAHELGIVHRDLKPENVMIVRSGGDEDFVKVLDFGIAKQLGPDTASLTGAGMALGTPLYMSPEAAAGEEIGVPADVYAIGVIFYQALAGETPFSGDNPTAVLIHQLQTPPPLLSTRPAAANVPTAIERLVHRCLAKSAAERPADGRAFLQELDAAVKVSGSAIAPVRTAPRPALASDSGASSGERRLSRRRSARAWTVGVLVGAIAAFAAVALWPRAPASDAERVALLERRAEAAFAAGKIDGPGGAIALTDLLLTLREDDPVAADLRRRMLRKLQTEAAEAEREGRLAAAIDRLALAARLSPDDASLEEQRRRLESLLHSGEPTPPPSAPEPSAQPDVVAGAGTRQVRIAVEPEAPVVGRPTTLRAILRGFDHDLERSHFHVRAATGGMRFSPTSVDAAKQRDATYTANFTFPLVGRYQVAFASHDPESPQHIDQAIEVVVGRRAGGTAPADDGGTATGSSTSTGTSDQSTSTTPSTTTTPDAGTSTPPSSGSGTTPSTSTTPSTGTSTAPDAGTPSGSTTPSADGGVLAPGQPPPPTTRTRRGRRLQRSTPITP